MKILIALLLIVVPGSVILGGCGTDPAPPAGFIENPDRMRADARVPFQRVWVKEGTDWGKYAGLLVARVDTDHILEHNLYAGGVDTVAAVHGLAGAMERIFKRAFFDDPKKRFRLVKEPGPGALILEMAIVEAKPGGQAGAMQSVQGKATAAFEGRIRDGASKEILATFADRASPSASFFSEKRWTQRGRIESILEDWAQKLVGLANRPENVPAAGNWPFELKTWPKKK